MRPYARPLSALPAPIPQAPARPASDPADARLAMFAAIEHASEWELLPLLKEALAAGASLSELDDHGCDVYTAAVCSNQPHAIATLAALRAELPCARDDGVDLLMYAAMMNHPDCCASLIWHLDMPCDAVDNLGRTALFHAVQHGCMEAAQVLLNYGASVNKGDVPPLHIAARQHDAAMIAFLIAQGATIQDSVDRDGHSALLTGIIANAPLNCLRLLAAGYPFAAGGSSEPDRVLTEALQRQNVDAVALLLAHGASPGNHDPDGVTSAWQIAADARDGHPHAAMTMLDLLATSCAERWHQSAVDEDNALAAFDYLLRYQNDPASLASLGMYPSLLSHWLQRLAAMPAENAWQQAPQSALHAAWLYLNPPGHKPAAVAAVSGAAAHSPDRAEEWQEKTEAFRSLQAAWLEQSAKHLVNLNQSAMRQSLTLGFFKQMTATCSDDIRLDMHIDATLKETSCLPDPMRQLIARAWYDAAREARNWLGTNVSLDTSEQLTLQRALLKVVRNVECSLAEEQHPVAKAWWSHLQHAAEAGLALRDFSADPARWLMRKEQRSTLRPVDTQTIADALCRELGLLPDVSAALASNWSDIIGQLATGIRRPAPHDMWREAARMLSRQIAEPLVIHAHTELPETVRVRIESWCVQQTGPLRGRVSVPFLVDVPHDLTSPEPLVRAQRAWPPDVSLNASPSAAEHLTSPRAASPQSAVPDIQPPRPAVEAHPRPPAEGGPPSKKPRL